MRCCFCSVYVFNREIKNIIPENRITRILSTPYEYIQNQTDTVTYLMIRQNMYFNVSARFMYF